MPTTAAAPANACGLVTLALNQTIPTRSRSPTLAPDPGNPVVVLSQKGITKENKKDISALATMLKTFGDFKCSMSSWNMGKEGAQQLIAIPRLLHEVATFYGNHRPASSTDLQSAVKELKAAISSSSASAAPTTAMMMSYASAAKRGGGNANPAAMQKQKMIAEMQQKQILVLLKNTMKDAPIHTWALEIVTRYCNDLITNYFKVLPDINPPTPHPLRGIMKSIAGNIMLTFKTANDTNLARAHANNWVKHIDSNATTAFLHGSHTQCLNPCLVWAR